MKKSILTICLATLALGQMISFAQAEQPSIDDRIDKIETDISIIKSTISDPEGAIQTAISDVNKLKKITVSGFLQARYEVADDAVNGKDKNTFDVRRARLKVVGTPTASTRVTMQLDIGSDKVSTKDAFVDFFLKNDPTLGGTLTAGQYAIPFGYQNTQSSSVMEVPERARVISSLFPGENDRGVKLMSTQERPLTWEIAVINGTGQNAKDNNQTKDIVGRMRYHLSDAIDFGVSAYTGKTFTAATSGSPAAEYDKTRYGADLQLYAHGYTLKGEFVTGQDLGKTKHGYYVVGTYNLTKNDTIALMYDTYDDGSTSSSSAGTLNRWTGGWTHYLDTNTRFRFFYELNEEERNSVKNNIFRAELVSVF